MSFWQEKECVSEEVRVELKKIGEGWDEEVEIEEMLGDERKACFGDLMEFELNLLE